MNITTRTAASGQITILELHGRLIRGETLQLREAFADLLNAGTTQILFDFDAVPFVDSSGLGELVSSASKLVKKAGNRLGLFGVSKRIQELFVLAFPISLPFMVFDSEAEAIEAVLRGDLKVKDKEP